MPQSTPRRGELASRIGACILLALQLVTFWGLMATDKLRERVLILGAAGRDFHIFNVCFRGDPDYQVVAFTATQIPGIELRRYPPALSG